MDVIGGLLALKNVMATLSNCSLESLSLKEGTSSTFEQATLALHATPLFI